MISILAIVVLLACVVRSANFFGTIYWLGRWAPQWLSELRTRPESDWSDIEVLATLYDDTHAGDFPMSAGVKGYRLRRAASRSGSRREQAIAAVAQLAL